FWKGHYGGPDKTEWKWTPSDTSIVREKVEKYWELLTEICDGTKNKSELVEIDKSYGRIDVSPAPSFGDGPDLDDDLPF
ncbi:MAG: hypothetical protein ACPGVN_05340, partial [Alphaproteobacteria bacterium]